MEAKNVALKIGIIGGTGIYQDLSFLENPTDLVVPTTPYGDPSDLTLKTGKCHGVDIVLLARHGRGHKINPSNVNYRANLWTLKEVGCSIVLVTCACGSLKNDVPPGSLAVLDQYIDRTSGSRASTFYSVNHVSQAHPFNNKLQDILEQAVIESGYLCTRKAILVCIEGPRYSTLAESRLYQLWGADLVGMTTVPEAPLAAELGLIYASLSIVTDYDCWHEDEDEMVNSDLVNERMKTFKTYVNAVLENAIKRISKIDWTEIIKSHVAKAKARIMTP